jgi:hypothetical protein
MGQVLILLAQRQVDPSPSLYNTRLQIEENVGEDIHIHFRNLRFEFTSEEFLQFSEAVVEARTRLVNRGVGDAR